MEVGKENIAVLGCKVEMKLTSEMLLGAPQTVSMRYSLLLSDYLRENIIYIYIHIKFKISDVCCV